MRIRAATAADAPALAEILTEGFETYKRFAPAGWESAGLDEQLAWLEIEFAPESRYRGWVAEDDEGLVGFAGYKPAADAGWIAIDDPQLGHVRHVFVRERAWGGPAARTLLAAAVDDARERGFTRMRLICVKAQARARAFYEREGWTTTGEDFEPPSPLGLPVVEYRRALR